jgi:hypothetical protein
MMTPIDREEDGETDYAGSDQPQQQHLDKRVGREAGLEPERVGKQCADPTRCDQ